MVSPTQWTWVWVDSGVGDQQGDLACCGSVVAKSGTRMKDWTELNWMDLAFQVPMYIALTASDFSSITSHIHKWVLFLLWPHLLILSEVSSPLNSSSILGIYQPGSSSQCPIFLPFHSVHGVLNAWIMTWFAIPFSSGPHFVRIIHHDSFILGGPTWYVS